MNKITKLFGLFVTDKEVEKVTTPREWNGVVIEFD